MSLPRTLTATTLTATTLTATTLTATTLTLLLATLLSSPSCTAPPCDATTDSCPCTRPEDCHPHPPCTAISCDGTCHVFPMAAGVGCLLETCTDPDVCHGVCDGLGACIGCLQSTDCAPGHTCEPGNVCSRCDDGIRNGDETAVDCGGSCPLCPGTCNVDADCPGGYCWEGLCARCDDGIQNGDEVGVDCSGFVGHCIHCTGFYCKDDAECFTGICAGNGVCCTVPCEGCNACGFSGECKPQVGNLPWANCPEGQLCGHGNGCAWPDGHACTKPEECVHLACVNGVCT